MIVGVGTDIVEIPRIVAALERHGERFAKRILSEAEWLEWLSLNALQRPRMLAKRFAAKEAFSKAVGTGIGRGFGFQDLTVVHDGLGKPSVALNPACSSLDAWSTHRIHLSLSDEQHLALAFCVIEQS